MIYNLSALNIPVPCFSHAFLTCCRVSALIPSLTQQSSRSLTYYSVGKGKRKTVKAVTERFMRLHCGLWIRRKVQFFYSLLHIKNWFQSDFLLSAINRPDTKRNCGRRSQPGENVWGSMCSVTKRRASFWTKWQPLFGKGGTGTLMIRTWNITIGSTSKCN